MIEPGARQSPATAISLTEDVLLDNLRPIERFLIVLKAPETKRQYPKRLESFFDFLQLQGNLQEKTVSFYQMMSQKESEWLTNQRLKVLRYQKDRVLRKEIEEATVSNYFKAIKLFCEMNNIMTINWNV